jgi:uncharacterized membrane protein
MIPLLVLAVLFIVLSLAGLNWWLALRVALGAMFLLTASAHWGKRRPDLIRMVPAMFPRPDLLVTMTGILEIAGAVGLLYAPTARAAGVGLSLLMICLFPANIRAAREKLTIGGRPVPSLLPRAAIQIVFVAAAVAVVFGRK